MYIIAIAWLYIFILLSLTSSNATKGILIFLLGGLAPIALFLSLAAMSSHRKKASAPEAGNGDSAEGNDRAESRGDQ